MFGNIKTLRGSISKSAKAEAPPKNPLLSHAVLVWGRACLGGPPWGLGKSYKKKTSLLARGMSLLFILGKFNWVDFDSWSHGWGEDNAS
mgnify:CR=1 FL=1